MAISFVSAGTGSETSATWGAGHQADDIGILFVEHGNNSAAIATPTGFTKLLGPVFGAANTALTIFWKIATSNSEAAVAVDFAAGGTQNHKWGHLGVWRGVNTATPIDYQTQAIWTIGATTTYLPSITTLVNGCMIVGASTWDADSAGPLLTTVTNASLSSVSERIDGGTITGNGGGIAVVDGVLATLGSSGLWQLDWSTSVLSAMAAFALIPAGANLNFTRQMSQTINM